MKALYGKKALLSKCSIIATLSLFGRKHLMLDSCFGMQELSYTSFIFQENAKRLREHPLSLLI